MRLLKQFAKYATGSLFALLAGLITTPILTRLISTEEMGKYSMFITIGSLIASILYLGLDQSYVRFYFDEKKETRVYSTNLPPYGYQKDPEDNHHLIIDETEAAVVRRVFDMFLSGKKAPEIAKRLTAEHIETPSRRNYESGQIRIATDTWQSDAVRRMLKNKFYTGTIILNRSEHIYGEGRSRKNDQSEWYYFNDRHEAIVSREQFDEVHRSGSGYPIRCGHCGKLLSATTSYENTMRCLKHDTDPDAVCGDIRIRSDVLSRCISDLIRQQAQVFVEWADLKSQILVNDKNLSYQLANVRRLQTIIFRFIYFMVSVLHIADNL